MAENFSISRSASATEWPATPARPPRFRQDRAGLYAEARWTVSETLQAHLGLRQDDTDDAAPVRTPRLALVYGRGDFSTKLIYGEAFRAPQPWDRMSDLGNPDLAPEDARSLEWSLGYVPSGGTQALLSLYRSRIDGLLVRRFEPAGSRWVNAAGITTRGLELSLDHQWSAWRVWGHYSFVDATEANGHGVPEIARHTARLGLGWRADERLHFALTASHLGARDNPQPIPGQFDRRLGGATLFDVRGTFSIYPAVDLRLQVENLGDHVYHHPSNLAPSRYRQPGRTAWLSLDIDLPR